MPKGTNLERLGQPNDAKVCIEGRAVVVRVNSSLRGCWALAVPKHDVKGGALFKDGEAASSCQNESVGDHCTGAEVKTGKADSNCPRKGKALLSSSCFICEEFSQINCKCRREKKKRENKTGHVTIIFLSFVLTDTSHRCDDISQATF